MINTSTLIKQTKRQTISILLLITSISILGLSLRAFSAWSNPSLYLNFHLPYQNPLFYLTKNLVLFLSIILYAIVLHKTRFYSSLTGLFLDFYTSLFLIPKKMSPTWPSCLILFLPLLYPFLIYFYWSSPPSIYRDLSLSLLTYVSSLFCLSIPVISRSSLINNTFLIYNALCALSLSFILGRQSLVMLVLAFLAPTFSGFSNLIRGFKIKKEKILMLVLSLILASLVGILFLARTFNRDLSSFEFSNFFAVTPFFEAVSFAFSMHDSEVFLRDFHLTGGLHNLLIKYLYLSHAIYYLQSRLRTG